MNKLEHLEHLARKLRHKETEADKTWTKFFEAEDERKAAEERFEEYAKEHGLEDKVIEVDGIKYCAKDR